MKTKSLIVVLLLVFTLSGCVSENNTASKETHTLENSEDTASESEKALESSEDTASESEKALESSEDTDSESAKATESSAGINASTGNVSLGQRNALNQAKNYLSIMAFSYEGLIKQLEYEGYSHEEAVYAADNCGADWHEQAAEKAKDYLEIMSFSRSGLIKQLEYEGFTPDEAEYGASAVGY